MTEHVQYNSPVTGQELARRCNKLLAEKRQRLVLDDAAKRYVLVDFSKVKPVDISDFADKLGCMGMETLAGDVA